MHEICAALSTVVSRETLTDSVRTSLFSITLASPTTFPISLSRDAKDSWACRVGKHKTKQRRQQLAKAENWTPPPPHLYRSSIRDTGNHCSAGNVFYARFAQGTNTFAKIDMSPYNQYVACQLACILKQFYGGNSNSLTSSYYVKKLHGFFFFVSCESSCTGRSPEAWLLICIYTEHATNHRHQ